MRSPINDTQEKEAEKKPPSSVPMVSKGEESIREKQRRKIKKAGTRESNRRRKQEGERVRIGTTRNILDSIPETLVY